MDLKPRRNGLSKSAEYQFLSLIDDPSDLKKLTEPELVILAEEIRQFLIETVSRTGGHLGSNLGSVELTIALHYAFNTPEDLIVWDVGAQAYPHKILTGRRKLFHTNRQYGGISGFPRRDESPYDTFGVGHSSTSISSALGMAVGSQMLGKSSKAIAVIGDGGMTGGMAFEGLNQAGVLGRDIMVVLNDNSMSISPSVGALAQHVTSLRSDVRFEKLKDTMWDITGRLPKGVALQKALRGVDSGLRAMIDPGLWFERLGFRYVGPIDGNDLPEVLKMFKWLRGIPGPVLVHLLTEKGRGYKLAEKDNTKFHGVGKFDPQTGPVSSKNGVLTYSEHFSDELEKITAENPKVVSITPAMIEGSAMGSLKEHFPDRCFDVGIAEQHAVTFAAGLASQGIRAVAVIYSTFLQRAFDQVIHDVALQNLPVVFGIDRAGIVGEDGPTHHGAFDISYLRFIPNLRLLVPRDGEQLRLMLRASMEIDDEPVAIRFPRGVPPTFELDHPPSENVWQIETLREGKDGVVIGLGTLLSECMQFADELDVEQGINIAVVDLRCVKPLDEDGLTLLASRYPLWLSVEENVLMGGAGSALLEFLNDSELSVNLKRVGLPNRFITHGDRVSLMKEVKLDKDSLKEVAKDFFKQSTNKNRLSKSK